MKTDENFGSVRPFGFRAPRIATNFSFLLEVSATAERYEAVCTDISEDGLAAELDGQLAPKSQVIMRMLLPGDTLPLQIGGSVENSQDGRCGVNFVYASPEERKRVQAFIQSLT
jgi:hypothetical protein